MRGFGFIIWVVTIVFIAATLGMALEPDKTISQYGIQQWNTEKGLPGNRVSALHQTKDGYIWIGTHNGMARFDGVQFEIFSQETVPGLPSNVILSFYEDRKGNLWIGTANGLICFNKGEFKFYNSTLYKGLAKIRAIGEDKWGNLWIGSYPCELTYMNGDKFTTYNPKYYLPGNRFISFFSDDNNTLWITTLTGVSKLVSPGVIQDDTSLSAIPFYKTAYFYDRSDKSLWIGATGKGIFRSRNGGIPIQDMNTGSINRMISALWVDKMKNLWIGTEGAGLLRAGRNDSLDCGLVISILEDKEGNLWIGTFDNGLFQLKDSKFLTLSTADGLSNNLIRCVVESQDGSVWMGTEYGLNHLKDGKVNSILTTKQGLLSNTILCLYESKAGCLWIGTRNGLHKLKDGRLTSMTIANGLADNIISSIKEDKMENIWIGTSNGLNLIDNKTGKIVTFTTREGLVSNQIPLIFEDSRGTIWIGTENGLNCINTVQDNHNISYEIKKICNDKRFNSIYEDKKNTLWFGTDKGLFFLKQPLERQRMNAWNPVPQKGLLKTEIKCILEDNLGFLWLTEKDCISRVKKKYLEDCRSEISCNIKPEHFNERDGLKSSYFMGSGIKTKDGMLLFPTTNGALLIDPSRIKKNYYAPPAMISKLLVDGTSANIRPAFESRTCMEFSPEKRRFEFFFTAVSFINPQRIKFKTRLEGYDTDWVDEGNNRSVMYMGLKPGYYKFKVIACNPDGIWNKKEASFSFYLKPYFYQTYWFYLLVIIASLLSVYFWTKNMHNRENELAETVRRRTLELEERNIELEEVHSSLRQNKEIIEEKNRQLEEQSEKLKEMDEIKSRFFTNISHEFRTPLTLIMSPLEQMLEGPREEDAKEKKKIRMMMRNAQRLLNLINQLLELSKFDSGTIKLKTSEQNIVPFLEGMFHSFDSLAIQNELEISFQTEYESILLYYDREKLEEVFCNILSNAFKFTPPGGKISLWIKKIADPNGLSTEEFLEISVKDTGPGIPREQLEHVFDRYFQSDNTYELHRKGSGIGLAIAKEIVELHHGSICVKSKVGEGTEFITLLPMGKTHLLPDEIDETTLDSYGIDSPSRSSNLFANGDSKKIIDEIQPAHDESTETEATGKEIILVIEDSVDVREYLRISFEPQYRVVGAKDGIEGINKAKDIIPDLIVCDVMMPGIDGYETTRILKNDITTSHIPILLLTAKASEENFIQGFETGADAYLTKPFSTRVLKARIKNLIDIRRKLQQNLNREITLQSIKTPVSSIDKEFIKELKTVINENISNPDFNVDLLCKKLHMSHSTLFRKIEALSGESPTEFIRSYRLKKGAELLQNNFGTILEVALEVGFSSANYFTKCFKKKFNKLPSEYQTQSPISKEK